MWDFFILRVDQQSFQNMSKTFFHKNIINFFSADFFSFFGFGAGNWPKLLQYSLLLLAWDFFANYLKAILQ